MGTPTPQAGGAVAVLTQVQGVASGWVGKQLDPLGSEGLGSDSGLYIRPKQTCRLKLGPPRKSLVTWGNLTHFNTPDSPQRV